MESKNIPGDLALAIKNNNLVIFVGAGLSYNLKNVNHDRLEGWKNLVLKMLNHMQGENFDVAPLIGLVERYDPIDILQLVEKDTSLPKHLLLDFVRKFYRLHGDNDFSLHRKIVSLSKIIVTTNYDVAFEKADDELRMSKAFKGMDFNLSKMLNEALLFKLHGCCEYPDSMVLFPSHYRALYESNALDAKHALSVFQHIVMGKTILFLGCGMGDFQINGIFRHVKEMKGGHGHRHFIVTTGNVDSSLDFLTPVSIRDHSGLEKVIDALLSLKQNKTNSSQDLQGDVRIKLIEEQLFQISGERDRQAVLLKREALKYFSSAIQLHKNGFFENAINEYSAAIELAPGLDGAYYNLASALSIQAHRLDDDDLYQRCFAAFKNAGELSPNDDSVFFNWGNSLYRYGSWTRRIDILREAVEKYKVAITLGGTYDHYNNCGLAVFLIGKLSSDVKELEDAVEFYDEAFRLDPEKAQIHNNLGILYSTLGKLKKDMALLDKSFDYYKNAISLNDSYHWAFNNYGTALMDLADLVVDMDRHTDLLEESFRMLTRAVALGGPCYNLACLAAVRGQKAEAMRLLEQSLVNREVPFAYVLSDPDWLKFEKDSDFNLLRVKYETMPATGSNESDIV